MQNVCGTECISRRSEFRWYRDFRSGRSSTDDRSRPGQSKMVITRKQLQMWTVSFESKDLAEEQKIHRMSVSVQHLMRYYEMENQFLSRIIAADETWWKHHFNPATKSMSMESRPTSFPRPKKACLSSWFIILHDNDRSHVTVESKTLLWEVLENPPYNPQLSPCDYPIFSSLKKALK
ncbi:jerky protein [Trichonephila clavipes]|nr:jerky protein [Trichonephila clavipes]